MSKWYACSLVMSLLKILHFTQGYVVQDSATIPAYTYKFNLEQNQVINATLDKEQYELQLLLYQKGQNILNNSEAIGKSKRVILQQSNSTNKSVNMLFHSTSYPSSYYLRVIPVTLYYQVTHYTLNVVISNFSQGKYTKHKKSNFYGSIGKYKPDMQFYHYVRWNSSIIVGIAGTNRITPILYNPRLKQLNLQYEIQIPQNIPVYLDSRFYSIQFSKYQSQDQYNFQPYFQHDFTNLTDIFQFHYYVNTQESGFVRQIPIELIVVVTLVANIMLLGCIWSFYDLGCRQRPRRGQNAEEIAGGNRNNGQDAVEIRKIQIQEWELCAICLQENCNSHLPCGHVFHENCIKKWVFLKRECPSCRASYGLNAITTPVKPLKDDP